MRITRVQTATPWEQTVGYARAVRGGNLVLVAGTVGAGPDGHPVAPDAYGQAVAALRIVGGALERLGSRLDHVLRLRIHYTDPGVGPEVTRALREAFGDALPAITGVQVRGLVDPAFLVEIEADAVVADWEPDPSVKPIPEWDEPVD